MSEQVGELSVKFLADLADLNKALQDLPTMVNKAIKKSNAKIKVQSTETKAQIKGIKEVEKAQKASDTRIGKNKIASLKKSLQVQKKKYEDSLTSEGLETKQSSRIRGGMSSTIKSLGKRGVDTQVEEYDKYRLGLKLEKKKAKIVSDLEKIRQTKEVKSIKNSLALKREKYKESLTSDGLETDKSKQIGKGIDNSLKQLKKRGEEVSKDIYKRGLIPEKQQKRISDLKRKDEEAALNAQKKMGKVMAIDYEKADKDKIGRLKKSLQVQKKKYGNSLTAEGLETNNSKSLKGGIKNTLTELEKRGVDIQKEAYEFARLRTEQSKARANISKKTSADELKAQKQLGKELFKQAEQKHTKEKNTKKQAIKNAKDISKENYTISKSNAKDSLQRGDYKGFAKYINDMKKANTEMKSLGISTKKTGNEISLLESKGNRLKIASRFKKINSSAMAVARTLTALSKRLLQVALNSRKFSTHFNKIASGTRVLFQLRQSISGLNNAFRSLGLRVSALGAVMSAPFLISLRSGIQFTNQLAKLQGALRLTADRMVKVTEKAREMGSKTMFTATESADAMFYLAQAGLKAEGVIASVGDTLNLAAAGDLGMGESADMITDVSAQFGIAATDMTRVADTLVSTSLMATTTVRQLGEAFSYVGGQADSIGQSIEETSLQLAILAQRGQKGSVAGTGLASIFRRLSLPDVQKEIEGLTEAPLDRFENGVLDITKIMIRLGKALGGAVPDQKYATILKLFQRIGARAASNIMGVSSKELANMREAQSRMNGIAEEIRKVRESRLGGQFEILKSTINDVANEVTLVLEPALIAVFNKLKPFITLTKKWVSDNKRLVVSFGLVSVSILGLGAALTGIALVISPLMTAMLGLSSIAGVFATLATGSIMILSGAFGVLTTTAGIAAGTITAIFSALVPVLTTLAGLMGTGMATALTLGLTGVLLLAVPAFVVLVIGAFKKIQTVVGEIASQLKDDWASLFDGFDIDTFVNALKQGDIKTALSVMSNNFAITFKKIELAFTKTLNAMKKGIRDFDFMEAFKSGIDSVMSDDEANKEAERMIQATTKEVMRNTPGLTEKESRLLAIDDLKKEGLIQEDLLSAKNTLQYASPLTMASNLLPEGMAKNTLKNIGPGAIAARFIEPSYSVTNKIKNKEISQQETNKEESIQKQIEALQSKRFGLASKVQKEEINRQLQGSAKVFFNTISDPFAILGEQSKTKKYATMPDEGIGVRRIDNEGSDVIRSPEKQYLNDSIKNIFSQIAEGLSLAGSKLDLFIKPIEKFTGIELNGINTVQGVFEKLVAAGKTQEESIKAMMDAMGKVSDDKINTFLTKSKKASQPVGKTGAFAFEMGSLGGGFSPMVNEQKKTNNRLNRLIEVTHSKSLGIFGE